MDQALKDMPVEHFLVPDGIILKRVNLETGLPVPDSSQETIIEAFLDGTSPENLRVRKKDNSARASWHELFPQSPKETPSKPPADEPVPSEPD